MSRHSKRRTSVAASFLLFVTLAGCRALPSHADPGHDRQAALTALSRIGVVGASQSAGFRAGISLGTVLKAAVLVPHQIVETSNVLFFMNPDGAGEQQTELLEQHDVSTVVALDYLFWFGYGEKNLASRRRDLQHAFNLLDGLHCPVFVGDLPDMHGASEVMLPARAIPPVEELAVLNAEIAAWAAAHPQIHLLPLARWMRSLRAGDELQVDGETLHPSLREVMSSDLLHTNRAGQFLLASLILNRVRDTYRGLTKRDLILDPKAIAAAVSRAAAVKPGRPAARKSQGTR